MELNKNVLIVNVIELSQILLKKEIKDKMKKNII